MGRAWAALALVAALAAECRADPGALPRIGTQGPRFVDTTTGATFVPRGNTYLILERAYDAAGGAHDVHCNFMEDVYDPAQVDRDLADMARTGNNVVRVFLGGDGPTSHERHWGIGGPPGTVGLWKPYVDNFVDFVKRANAHRLYVVPITSRLPLSRDYQDDLARGVPENVTDENTFTMSQGAIDAKARWLRELATRLRDESLSSAILYWEADAEIYVLGNAKPFSLASGTVTTADGRTYDLAIDRERQDCAESNMVHWANVIADRLHQVDPQALVTAPIFSNRAVGRTHASSYGIHLAPGGDPRFPIDPTVMRARSRFSFTSIDAYSDGNAGSLDADLAELDFARWDLAKMPIGLGEFGAFKGPFPSLAGAASAMAAYRDRARALGFAGFIFWVWSDRAPPAPLQNSPMQSAWWTASANGGLIDAALAGSAPARDPSTVFDEAWYLMTYPDVADAVQRGWFATGREHYDRWGAREGRNPNALFDERSYLGAYDDVAAAVAAGTFVSGFAHYVRWGRDGGLLPHPPAVFLFDEEWYLAANSDVAAAVKEGSLPSGRRHYDLWGAREGRDPNALFDEPGYLRRYPDVAAAVARGDFASGWAHFKRWGFAAGLSAR